MDLHGAYFGVAEGSLFVLDPATKEFRSMKESAGNRRLMRWRAANACSLFLCSPP